MSVLYEGKVTASTAPSLKRERDRKVGEGTQAQELLTVGESVAQRKKRNLTIGIERKAPIAMRSPSFFSGSRRRT